MLNLDSTWSQLSFEVYNMHIAQNLNFWISRQFLTPKISNFQILSYRNVMYLKRKLRTCRIQIQEEKVGFFWKNWIFFRFLRISRQNFRGPSVFEAKFFKNLKKKIWKMALLGPVDCWKEQSHEKSAHLMHCPKSHGQKTARGGSLNPSPCRIGLKQVFTNKF